MELITKEACVELMNGLDDIKIKIEKIILNKRPSLNGEEYLSGAEVCKVLNITKRTLQEYRDMRQIPYILICGKILYKESDLLKILEDKYVPILNI